MEIGPVLYRNTWWFAGALLVGLASCAGPDASESGSDSSLEPTSAGASASPDAAPGADPSYVQSLRDWQLERENGLKADDSWLTVAGLYWLREGTNTVGTDGSSDFVLPEGSAPGRVGAFEFKDRKTTFAAADGVTIKQGDEVVTSTTLEMGEKYALQVDELKMWLHYSGERLAIRIRDLESPLRRDFAGLEWFPINPVFRVHAKFTPHAEPKKVDMLNILGDIETFESPGYVDFELNGESVRMEPLNVREGALWFVFRDATSGKEVYPAARFLRTEAPDNGEVVIDFNRSYNPPCAYNPFTTCPMPTEENRLGMRIEAGEKKYKKHS